MMILLQIFILDNTAIHTSAVAELAGTEID